MKVRNYGKRVCSINGNYFGIGEEKEVENVKPEELKGMTLEIIKQPKKGKE